MKKTKEIFFDIDGVLTIETEGFGKEIYQDRTPNKTMIRLVNMLQNQERYNITLFTARHEEDREVTETWLEKYGVNYSKLILGKPHYDLLIDDKAMEFKNFPLDVINKINDLDDYEL